MADDDIPEGCLVYRFSLLIFLYRSRLYNQSKTRVNTLQSSNRCAVLGGCRIQTLINFNK